MSHQLSMAVDAIIKLMFVSHIIFSYEQKAFELLKNICF